MGNMFLLVRGNHTNNYSEAGFRILKDLIFSRVKAYNHDQMFSFITESLELYYIRKVLSAAHNRIDRYISIKFQGLKCANISHEHIRQLDSDAGTYLVNSQTERGVKYLVDMTLGVCSCDAGRDGSPCSHQATIVKCHHISSVNCVSVLSPLTRKQLAIALGSSSVQSQDFYSSIHEKELSISVSTSKQECAPPPAMDGPAVDGLMLNLLEEEEIGQEVQSSDVNCDKIVQDLEKAIDNLKERIRESSKELKHFSGVTRI